MCESANKPVKNGRHFAPEKKQIPHKNGLLVPLLTTILEITNLVNCTNDPLFAILLLRNKKVTGSRYLLQRLLGVLQGTGKKLILANS